MHRPLRIFVLATAVVGFVVISVLLARFLSVENVERDAIFELLRAQARGDAGAMLARLDGCRSRPACAAAVELEARRLRGPGDVKILARSSGTAYAVTGASGQTRVAWKIAGRSPVVQCVLVDRRGDALSGVSVTLRALSLPIAGTANC